MNFAEQNDKIFEASKAFAQTVCGGGNELQQFLLASAYRAGAYQGITLERRMLNQAHAEQIANAK